MSPPRRLAALVTIGLVAGACASVGGPPSGAPTSVTGDSSSRVPSPGDLRVTTAGWATDFSIASVDLGEFRGGGPPKDGIPAIDDPRSETIADARAWLAPTSPVISLEIGGAARAYPLAILVWHEIVNDALGGTPVVVTFCPLCHTALVFER